MSSLFKTPDLPPPPKPVQMPDPEDMGARQARRQQMELMRKRGGRDSTILSTGGGSQDYSKKSLG